MYKKRFTKWNFQKNCKRSAPSVRHSKTKGECTTPANIKARPSRRLRSLPAVPGLGHRDALTLKFLTSVRTWSVAFFESVQGDGPLASRQPQGLPVAKERPSSAQEIGFTLKLVIDLLDRGRGDLAGRMARKAFLLAEDMLTYEGPALVWNLLQMMHYMVSLRHLQLFRILVAHLIGLAEGQMPETHPLPVMLRGLRGLVAGLPSTAPTPSSGRSSSSSSLSSFPPQSSSTGSDENMAAADPRFISGALPPLIEQAWIINAEIFFGVGHFDPRLYPLYFRITWDLASIETPAAIVNTATQWFTQMEAHQMPPATTMASYCVEGPSVTVRVEEDTAVQHLLTKPTNASPPRDYDMLRASTIVALRERADFILSKGSGFNGDATLMLRIMVGLATAKVLETIFGGVTRSGEANRMETDVSRLQAGNVACAIRILVDLNVGYSGDELRKPSDAVEQIRTIVALREYAQGETNPQVVREMCLLRDALVAAGKHAEAREVERDVYRRVEKYIRDIPVDSA